MYYSLAWHFCSKSSQNEIEKIQYRSLKLITNNYHSNCELLLNETRSLTMEIKRLRVLALEIVKTLNNLNRNFMKDVYNFSPYSTHGKHDIFLLSQNEMYQIGMIEASELWTTNMEIFPRKY